MMEVIDAPDDNEYNRYLSSYLADNSDLYVEHTLNMDGMFVIQINQDEMYKLLNEFVNSLP